MHRDLKPENIFLSRQAGDEGGGPVLKVLDFGIAKFHKKPGPAKGTTPGMIIGTMQYMAPEQLQGAEADPRSDVYALGLILVEMLTGRLPWGQSKEQSDAQFALRMVQPAQKLAELRRDERFSPELQRLADDMLTAEPASRPAQAGELMPRLRQLPEAAAQFPADSISPPDSLRSVARSASAQPMLATQRTSAFRLSALPPASRRALVALPLLVLVGLGRYLGRRPAPPAPPVQTLPSPDKTPERTPDKAPPPAKTLDKPIAGKPSATSRTAVAHSSALQVQFATPDAKGVTLSCGGRRLGAPSCVGSALCRWTVSVSAGQKCSAERGKAKKQYSYAELQKTAPDRKNLIHVLVYF